MQGKFNPISKTSFLLVNLC